jgi:hypothetical protein
MDVKEGSRDMLGYLVTCVDASNGSRTLLGRAGQSCGAWCATRGSWRVLDCAGVHRLHKGVQSLAGFFGLVGLVHMSTAIVYLTKHPSMALDPSMTSVYHAR